MWPIKKQRKWCEVRVKGAGRHLRRQTRESSFMLNNRQHYWAQTCELINWFVFGRFTELFLGDRQVGCISCVLRPRAVAACSWPLNQAECWALRGDMWSLTETPSWRRSHKPSACLEWSDWLSANAPFSYEPFIYFLSLFFFKWKTNSITGCARLGCSCESQSWKSVQDRVRHHILCLVGERAKLLI